MYYLIFKEVEALRKSDIETTSRFIEMQHRFLNSFLGLWINSFCEKIKSGTDNEFYKALAECASVFVMNSFPVEIMTEKLQGVLD